MTTKRAANRILAKENSFHVDPWDVQGKVDYEKLVEKFQTQRTDAKLLEDTRKLTKELHVFLRRDIVFSHRDFNKILEEYTEGKKFFLYTGRAPSLGMHIGHLLPFLFTKWLQEKFHSNVYIQITDDEKFLSNPSYSLDDTRKFARENILDIVAIGFEPNSTFIFQDTEYLGKMYPLVVKIAKKLTFSQLRSTFGFESSMNIGLGFYPAVQMCTSMFEKGKRCLIPAGADQDPYWRLQRDIAESLGYYKVATLHMKFLPPLTGVEGKMSSSQPESAIYLNDDPKTVRRKILRFAFSGGQSTTKLHRELGGNPDVDVSFQWLNFLFEPDDREIERIGNEYRSGKLLTGELKEILVERVNKFLAEHRERRKEAEGLVDVFKYTGKLATKMQNTIHE